MSGTAVCTLFSRSHLPRARVLQESLRRFHPELDLFMLVTDLVGAIDASGVPDRTTVLAASQVMPASDVARLSALYDPLEYCAAFKPFVIAHLLGRGYDKILYFDSDILLLNPLDGILRELEEAAVLLTPHLLRPIESEGKEQAELEILLAGTFNSGFVGISRRPESEAFLAWWQARLSTHCFVDRLNGMFADQRWLDLAPLLFDGIGILRDPGCNVGYWNLHSRKIGQVGDRWTADGSNLVFFHFSGFDPARPSILSRWHDRAQPVDPLITRLASDYAQSLEAADFDQASRTPYPFDRFSNGVPFNWLCRDLLRRVPHLLDQFPRPLDVAAPSFFEWLRQVSWYEPAATEVSYYVQALHLAQTASQQALPGSGEGDPGRWNEWLSSNRAKVPEVFLGEA